MDLTRLLRHAAVYGGATVLSRAASFLLLPIYTRVLSPADYGIIDIVLILTNLVLVTLTLEITQGLARFFPEADTDDARQTLASTTLWFTMAVYTMFAISGLVVSDPLARAVFRAPGHGAVLRVTVLAIWCNGIFHVALNQLRWALMPRHHACASVLATLTSMVTSIILVVGWRTGVAGVIWGYVVGYGVGAATALWFGRAQYGLRFDPARARAMLGFSAPLVASSVGVYLSTYVDRIAIQRLMTAADLGLFGIGYRFASITMLLVVGFQAALTPLIYQHYREASTPAALARVFRGFLAFAFVLFATIVGFRHELLHLFTTPSFYDAERVIPYLVPALLLMQMYIFAPGLSIAKRTRVFAAISLGAAAVNLVLNMAFIPVLGIQGAALATLIGSGLAFGAHMLASQRLYPVPHHWGRLGIAAVAAAGIALATNALPAGSWIAGTVKVLLLAILVPMFVGLRLVEKREIGMAWRWATARLRATAP